MGSTIVSSFALDEIQFKRIYVLQFLHLPKTCIHQVLSSCHSFYESLSVMASKLFRSVFKKSAIQLYSIRGLNPFRGWHKINCKDCQKTPMHGGQEYFYFMFIRPNNTEDFCQKA